MAPATEWLESDGLGGFASGPVRGPRTRRYHALLLTAAAPPTGRVALVQGFEAWVETDQGRFPISTQHYAPDVTYPDGVTRQTGFSFFPWPRWEFRAGGAVLAQELFVDRDRCETVLRWRRLAGEGRCRLELRLLLSGRDLHGLHRENGAFDFTARVQDGRVCWRPYASLPAISALSNGTYRHEPDWFRQFLYTEEQARGLDCIEDLASPGLFGFDLAEGEAVMVLRAGDGLGLRPAASAAAMAAAEQARRQAAGLRGVAAESFVVDRGAGRTIIAGFPWFTDWGRDTFIAMRGLLLQRRALVEAERVLRAWAGQVDQGMLPNRFPDAGAAPEFNAVDASLWFIVAAWDFLQAARGAGLALRPGTEAALLAAVRAILDGYAKGTRFAIGMDTDGLLAAGVPGVQLTWMDAKTGDHVWTPRIGKPVEVQALWINALRIGTRFGLSSEQAAERAAAAFAARFPDPASGGLFDVVDVDHQPGTADASIRPNQVLAVGGLPFPVLEGAAAARVVALVEAKLLTPRGLRSLAPDDPAYIGHYRGGPSARDAAYHQGTVWPWLIGPFVAAWIAVRGGTAAARAEARTRLLGALLEEAAANGHLPEVADGDPPHAWGGCPFQAWSLGELIRAEAACA